MKRIQKWSALLMAVTLLFTLAAPAALAAESTVTIKTPRIWPNCPGTARWIPGPRARP